MRTLIVDDSPGFLRLLAAFLRDSPFASDGIAEASDGQQALDRLTQEAFDLVVTDVEMPMLDGRQLLRAMRATPAFAHIDVVMLGGGLTDDDASDLLALGAAAVLRKPFDRAQLIAVLSSMLSARS